MSHLLSVGAFGFERGARIRPAGDTGRAARPTIEYSIEPSRCSLRRSAGDRSLPGLPTPGRRRRQTGAPLYAVLGGFHLLRADQRRMEMTTEALHKLDIPLIVPCHCTGADAFGVLAAALGSTVSAGGPGVTFEF